MKSASHFLLVWVFVIGADMSVVAQKKTSLAQTPASPRIANIKDSNLVGGCGCYFQFLTESKRRSNRFIFGAGMDEEYAWMNIDGKDRKLRLFDSSKSSVERVGARSYEKFQADGIRVHVNYVVTRLCKPNDENCESTGYDATFSVTKGGRKSVIKGTGSCGC